MAEVGRLLDGRRGSLKSPSKKRLVEAERSRWAIAPGLADTGATGENGSTDD